MLIFTHSCNTLIADGIRYIVVMSALFQFQKMDDTLVHLMVKCMTILGDHFIQTTGYGTHTGLITH